MEERKDKKMEERKEDKKMEERKEDKKIGICFNGESGKLRYICEKKLSEGTFGKVYLARDPYGFQVALKQIPYYKLSQNPKLKDYLRREFEIIHPLNNIHVTKEYASFSTQHNIYTAMEYSNGGSLEEYLDSQRGGRISSLKELQDITQQITAGLSYLHSESKDKKPLSHRDLKPKNIVLHYPEENKSKKIVKLIDFDLVKKTERVAHDGNTMGIGTPMYMSPEMELGHKYSLKTDLWALGVIIYLMLFGIEPYRDTINYFSKILISEDNHLMEPPPIYANITQELGNLISKLLIYEDKGRLSADQVLNHEFFKMEIEESTPAIVDILMLEENIQKEYLLAAKRGGKYLENVSLEVFHSNNQNPRLALLILKQ